MDNIPQGQNAPSQAAAQPAVASDGGLAQTTLETLQPGQALAVFQQDPVGFVRRIVEDAAQTHLANLKEEAELRAALAAFRKAHPEFTRFEPFIMQEVVGLLRNDPEGASAPWDKLLEKAAAVFKQKFADTIKAQVNPDAAAQPPHMEAAGNRVIPEAPPAFSRDQISRMSLEEFLKNEAAINDALKGNRIR